MHTLATQLDPPVHAVAHVPQWALSTRVSTHVPPQSVWPAGHAHTPAAQCAPPTHTVAQLPQCASLEARSTQAPLHSI